MLVRPTALGRRRRAVRVRVPFRRPPRQQLGSSSESVRGIVNVLLVCVAYTSARAGCRLMRLGCRSAADIRRRPGPRHAPPGRAVSGRARRTTRHKFSSTVNLFSAKRRVRTSDNNYHTIHLHSENNFVPTSARRRASETQTHQHDDVFPG